MRAVSVGPGRGCVQVEHTANSSSKIKDGDGRVGLSGRVAVARCRTCMPAPPSRGSRGPPGGGGRAHRSSIGIAIPHASNKSVRSRDWLSLPVRDADGSSAERESEVS